MELLIKNINKKQKFFLEETILNRIDERLNIFMLNQSKREDIISGLTEKGLEKLKEAVENAKEERKK